MALLHPGIDPMTTLAATEADEMITAARNGVSGKHVKDIIDTYGHRELFSRIVEASESNFSRIFRKPKLSRAESEGVIDTLLVLQHATTVFGDKAIANEWLESPIEALGGEKPSALCDTLFGRKLVRDVLTQIEYGEFV